jgi:hypothetical protein
MSSASAVVLEFLKSQVEIRRTKDDNHYCSRSCAAKINNLGRQRNKPVERMCKICNKPFFNKWVENNRSKTVCIDCRKEHGLSINSKSKKFKESKLEDFLIEGEQYHISWKYTKIREFCRSWNRKIPKICQVCGYNKHTEMCHIKPLTSFSGDTLMSEINSPDNILILCPNCHWEFDNGLIRSNPSLKEIFLNDFSAM